MHSRRPIHRRTSRTSLFGQLAFHVLIVASGVAWAAVRYSQLEHQKDLPRPRNEPLTVAPLFDKPEMVSIDRLRAILYRLRPRFRGKEPRINNVDHALRFWGVEATFDDPECLSGVEMRELMLDHRRFQDAWGTGTKPLLLDTPYGVRPRVQQGPATSSHVDHTLATLAEVGTPLDYPVVTPRGETNVRAILEHSLRVFSVNQAEYEWSALAYALYLPPVREWITSDGQRISFDRIADRLMRQKLSQGVCYGNHRLHALVMLLRVDDQQSILSDECRTKILRHLAHVTNLLIASQHEQGYWDRDWDGARSPEDQSKLLPIARRVLETGHVLEWWALAPREVHPPDFVLVKAANWLCSAIEQMSDREIEANYTFLSHAGRALALWRGNFPRELLRPSETAL